ncbi:MAG: ABC transporter permease [Gammaproteobacteria bacterium]|nr:ABC transporter permease [Gammaproteobacteria bacterium]
MDTAIPTIPLTNLLIGFIPVILLLAIMQAWSLNALQAIYANGRMLIQLLAIGYVLTYVLETNEPVIVIAVIVFMIGVSAWIALRPLADQRLKLYPIVLISIGACGIAVMLLVTQLILDLPRWFEPRFVIPLAGMIFANTMNTISLAAERFRSELGRDEDYVTARRTAMEAALIPQINALLAVGLVSLPGMMTGQILSGIDPLVAARYQIMVMCMIFASAGLAAACYLALLRFAKPTPEEAREVD